MVREVALALAGKMVIALINIDENPLLARRFGITGVPTLLILQDGRELERTGGALTKDALVSLLSRHLFR